MNYDICFEYDNREIKGLIITLNKYYIEVKMISPYFGVCKSIDLEKSDVFRPANWPQIDSDFIEFSQFEIDGKITDFGKKISENMLKDIYDICNLIFLNIHLLEKSVDTITEYGRGRSKEELGVTFNQYKLLKKIKELGIDDLFYREELSSLKSDVQSWFKNYFSKKNVDYRQKFHLLINLTFDIIG